MMSVYALRNGMSEQFAAYTLTAAAIGSLIFPIPLGMLSDRIDRLSILLICVIVCIAAGMTIPLTLVNEMLFLVTIAVWAGFAIAIYSTALAMIGNRFVGRDLIVANAGFGVFYSIGAFIGPIVNGFALDRLDTYGLIISVQMLFGILLLALIFSWFRRSE